MKRTKRLIPKDKSKRILFIASIFNFKVLLLGSVVLRFKIVTYSAKVRNFALVKFCGFPKISDFQFKTLSIDFVARISKRITCTPANIMQREHINPTKFLH